MSRPRVALIAPNVGAHGGIQRYNERLGEVLAELTDTVVVSLDLDGSKPRALREALRAFRIVRRTRPELIVLGYLTFAPLAWVLRPWVRQYVVEVYGKEIWRPSTALERLCVRRARAVWTISSHTAEVLRRRYHAREVHDLKAYIDDRWFGAVPPRTGVFTVLTVCRLERLEDKGVDVCLDAMERLRTRAEVRYRVVGDGAQVEELRRQVRARDLTEVVDVVGGVPDDALAEEYRSADAVVLATPYREGKDAVGEGLGLVLLEGAASGAAVVTTKEGGTKDAVLDGQTGLLVPQADPAALADALLRLAEDRGLCAAMGARGAEWVRTTYGAAAYRDRVGAALNAAGVAIHSPR